MAEAQKDPVCGMEITDESNACFLSWNGKALAFCSNYCKERFQENPEEYAGSRQNLRN